MKRAGIFLTLISVMVFVFAGVALAAVINGNNANNTLVGTPRHDVIRGFGGSDTIRGRGGDDELMGGTGNDYIRAVDSREDHINCGRGSDRVRANPGDDIEGGCERVVRAGKRVGDGHPGGGHHGGGHHGGGHHGGGPTTDHGVQVGPFAGQLWHRGSLN